MDNVRNFIVLKTAIISRLKGLCDGQCPQFYRPKDGHNQQFDGFTRWTTSVTYVFGIASKELRPYGDGLVIFLGLRSRNGVHFTSCVTAIQRWVYAFGVASMEQCPLFFVVRDGHTRCAYACGIASMDSVQYISSCAMAIQRAYVFGFTSME